MTFSVRTPELKKVTDTMGKILEDALPTEMDINRAKAKCKAGDVMTKAVNADLNVRLSADKLQSSEGQGT